MTGTSHPQKTTSREDHPMRQIVMHSPKSCCNKSCAILCWKSTVISASPVSRFLGKEFGLKSRRPARKPYMTSMMKTKRLDFATHRPHWTLAEWKKVGFSSDECTMQQFVPHHRHIRCPLDKCFDKIFIVATMKHWSSSVIWGAMLCHGATGLYFILPNTTMNGPKYVELFKDKLKLHSHVHSCMIFMQDGARCQSLIKSSHWLSEVKQDLWTGMVQEQSRFQSNQEPVDYYEG